MADGKKKAVKAAKPKAKSKDVPATLPVTPAATVTKPVSFRDYKHFSNAGVSLGVDVRNGRARVTFAATNVKKGDRFCRATAREIINTRLDSANETCRAMHLTRNVVSFPYVGAKPRNEILKEFGAELLKAKIDERASSKGRSGSVDRIIDILQAEADKRSGFTHPRKTKTRKKQESLLD